MKQYMLNGQNMSTREAAYDEIARVLDLPAYFGRNLDALWDELSCMQGEIILVGTLNTADAYVQSLIATFADAANENSQLSFRIEG